MRPIKRCVGQPVLITWGSARGQEGRIEEVSSECPGMVTVVYTATVSQALCGIEPGDVARVFIHWTHTDPLV